MLWNETYVPVANALEPGTVLAIRGTVDKRDEGIRATAQKVRALKPDAVLPNDSGNGAEGNGAARVREEAPVTLRFAAGAAAEELRAVREILASSPGAQPVTLMLMSASGKTVRIEAGEPCRVALTPEIERRLAPWLGSYASD